MSVFGKGVQKGKSYKEEEKFFLLASKLSHLEVVSQKRTGRCLLESEFIAWSVNNLRAADVSLK